MANFKTKGNGPQVGKPKSHPSKKGSLMESGGGKNSPLPSNKQCQKITKLAIGTVNVQTLLKDGDLYQLEEELEKIRWDIIGLCETRRRGENVSHCHQVISCITRDQKTIVKEE